MGERSTGATEHIMLSLDTEIWVKTRPDCLLSDGSFRVAEMELWAEDKDEFWVPAEGFAIVPVSPVADPAVVEKCVHCRGTGKRDGERCQGCGGSGLSEEALRDAAIRATPEPERAGETS